MDNLKLKAIASEPSSGYVFEVATGKVIGWFDDEMDAIDFSSRKNSQLGANYSDWVRSVIRVIDLNATYSFLTVDHPYMLLITNEAGEEVFMDYDLKPQDGVEHFENMLYASNPGCTVQFIDMETKQVVREARS